jgi:hypothetical protein
MSEPIRIELTGKNGESWNRVFETLTGIVTNAVTAIAPTDTPTQMAAEQFVADIGEISKNWLKAKVERPSLENEKLFAEIVGLFEEAKLKKSQRERQEIENESMKLDLMAKRLTMAIKLLGFLQNHCTRDINGNMTLVFTNEELPVLLADVKARGASGEASGTRSASAAGATAEAVGAGPRAAVGRAGGAIAAP